MACQAGQRSDRRVAAGQRISRSHTRRAGDRAGSQRLPDDRARRFAFRTAGSSARMTAVRTITVLMSSDLLTLGRVCGVLRRRNVPIHALNVDSNGPPGVWRLTCEIEADDATVESLVLLMQNVVGVRKASASSPPGPLSVAERGNESSPFGDNMSSSVRVYYEADTDRARLRDRVFAIIGYGSQGHAHAQNLRDSGARVIVGLRPGGASWKQATADGLDVRPVADAAKAGDVIMMLVPDQEQRGVYEAAVAPALGG